MKQQTPLFGGKSPKSSEAIQRALAEAVQLHGAGRYDEALKLVASSGLGKTASGQNLIGDIHLKRGDAREALKAFDTAQRLAPTAPEPYANRGAALLELGRNDEALAAFDRALRMRPEYANAHFNRGNVLRALGRNEEAVTAYARATRAQPQFADAHLNRGSALGALKRWPEALEEFGKASRLRPNLIGAHIGRAMTYRDMGHFADAFTAIDAALATDPTNLEALRFRCSLLNAATRHEEALAAADALLAKDAGDAQALGERATALVRLRRIPEALVTVDALIAVAPDNAEAHVKRAAVFAEMGREKESLAEIAIARKLGAEERTYLPVLALARAVVGEVDEALADFERAIAADPGAYQTYYNRAFLRLQLGDWAGGWQDHEWRLKQHDHAHRNFLKHAPQWQGEPLAGRRLLVYGEQGLGDTIQFLRYISRLKDTGAELTLIIQSPLVPLVSANFPDIDVAGAVGMRRGFDYQVSLMSLPAMFHDTMETMPRETPYLAADPKRVEKWRAPIGNDAFNVGVVWQGALKYSRDATRSIPLAKYAPLATVPGVRLFSVQAVVGLDQLDRLGPKMGITRFGEELERNPDGLQEMAAIMANLDLLIMSDTAPTHLGGALGRPTWVALSRHPDWRWMDDREDSPWYPTMRLFRQPAEGDWDAVFERIAGELRGELSQRSG
jgi:tetratricopeptide (TPR) repeat protein